MKTTVYQTLEDRKNYDEVLGKAPFKCTRKDAWVGEGYYLWDTFIDNAIWWGNNAYKNKGKQYLIVKSEFLLDENCFDLLGNMNHQTILIEAEKLIKERRSEKAEINLRKLITLLREKKIFPYHSIRFTDTRKEGTISIHKNSFNERLSFQMAVKQKVQICIYNIERVTLQKFELNTTNRWNL